MIFLSKKKLYEYLDSEVQKQVKLRLKNLEETDFIESGGIFFNKKTVGAVVKDVARKEIRETIDSIKSEFAKEEFIDSVIERINKKQIK
jgi:hypothetical protein